MLFRSGRRDADVVVIGDIVRPGPAELQAVLDYWRGGGALLLAPGGRAIVLVPQGPSLYGTLDKVLGHVWNVWGDALDENPEGFDEMERWDIHRPAPDFDALEPSARLFPTGIKVIDLLTPYVAGGKIGRASCRERVCESV